MVKISNLPQIVANSSFISPLVELFGDVGIGSQSFIAGNTVVRADPGTQICIGNETNLQDNILFLASQETAAPAAPCGSVSSSTGNRVSIAHQAVVKNSRIGNFTFVGFNAHLNNVVLEDGAFVLHGAQVENVTIGKDKLVPIGAVITTQAEADALPSKTHDNAEFQDEVLEVNEEFAESYGKLYDSAGYEAVTGVSRSPVTSWNVTSVSPSLGENVQLGEFVRIVGDVQLGKDSRVGQRTSIRADEGSPIVIGENARIEDRVTFHALKGSDIRIGEDLRTADNIVFHGPLKVGDDLNIGDDAILFRSTVGNNVSIGTRAIVVGVTLRDGTQVPPNAHIITQELADKLEVVQ
ncbi:MAG: carbonate dehydratase [Drouetiella hepatica Uher 2000/2452]|uniref:Carbonate dehydratase n=1 Tax=Drouetiella hepatica Uher 2000/2452 TaxID=904376 RepID=A0A951Q5T1_9CYAN|nr:carbonate dehydratase [Drouetiella hepatica Uher 2000/2452]